MVTRSRTAKKSSGGGLTPKSFKGLSKKRFEKKGGANSGKRLILDADTPVPVQFLSTPDKAGDFREFEVHAFQEDNRWNFVPCAGDGCPLCQDEDSNRSSTSYRFCTNVYNLKDKRVQVLEGPRDMAGRVWYRFERAKSAFPKRTYEVTKFGGRPTSYDVATGEDKAVPTRGLKTHDLEEYLIDEMKRYYGDDLEAVAAGLEDEDELEEEDFDDEEEDEEDDLDFDDEDDDEDEEDEEEDDDEDEDDEEDDDFDDLDFDDDEEDEEDEPPPPRKSTRKPPAKKAPAKKAVAAKKASPSKKAPATRKPRR